MSLPKNGWVCTTLSASLLKVLEVHKNLFFLLSDHWELKSSAAKILTVSRNRTKKKKKNKKKNEKKENISIKENLRFRL